MSLDIAQDPLFGIFFRNNGVMQNLYQGTFDEWFTTNLKYKNSTISIMEGDICHHFVVAMEMEK